MSQATMKTGGASPQAQTQTTLLILWSLSLCHMLNDTIQSLLPALYPVLQTNYELSFTQIGILHFTFQATASLLQPAVGLATDRRPYFRLLTMGMGASLVGLVILAYAGSYPVLLLAAACVGIGSSIFHPDASRVARAASGGRYGFAQSLFQVGGNTGTAIGPLLAAYIVLPLGQPSVIWFSALALLGMIVLWNVGSWAKARHLERVAAATAAASGPAATPASSLPRGRVVFAIVILALLVFSKQLYTVSLSSYYTFYLIETFDLSIRDSQLLLFLFLAAAAAGTFLGGPIGDRFGRKTVMWFSILGVLPFTLLLPYADLFWTAVLTVIIGFVISSAFPAIVVFAQELVPGRVGLIAGIFFGFAFGMGGIGAAVLGAIADARGIAYVFQLCAFLPLLGLLTILLPPERATAQPR